jgi:D-alanyl-D-alanine carboxypeptidase
MKPHIPSLGAPGVQFAWTDRTGEVHTGAIGLADLGAQRPLTSSTPLMAYSMSKVLTSRAITVLERAGELCFDDLLTRYLPDQPWDPGITLRHLLEHRSGLPNPIPLRWVHLAADHAGFDEASALHQVTRSVSRLRFAPGTRTAYSNLGYWLLGHVVELITGQPFIAFVQESVLRPLSIAGHEISYSFPQSGGQASGYIERWSLLNLLRPLLTDQAMAGESAGRWLRIHDHYVNGPAFGGAIGTAGGFCKLGHHLLESGDQGAGWSETVHYLEKEGGGAGFHSLLRIDRRHHRVSVVMANASGFNVRSWLNECLPA